MPISYIQPMFVVQTNVFVHSTKYCIWYFCDCANHVACCCVDVMHWFNVVFIAPFRCMLVPIPMCKQHLYCWMFVCSHICVHIVKCVCVTVNFLLSIVSSGLFHLWMMCRKYNRVVVTFDFACVSVPHWFHTNTIWICMFDVMHNTCTSMIFI